GVARWGLVWGPRAALHEFRVFAVLAAIGAAGEEGVSGTKIAEELNCSRAAVHRHVEALRRSGGIIEGTATGYRLIRPPDLVLPRAIEPQLVAPIKGPVVWRRATNSTNDDVAREARKGAEEGLL